MISRDDGESAGLSYDWTEEKGGRAGKGIHRDGG